MAYIVMAYVVMAYVVMVYIVMADIEYGLCIVMAAIQAWRDYLSTMPR